MQAIVKGRPYAKKHMTNRKGTQRMFLSSLNWVRAFTYLFLFWNFLNLFQLLLIFYFSFFLYVLLVYFRVSSFLLYGIALCINVYLSVCMCQIAFFCCAYRALLHCHPPLTLAFTIFLSTLPQSQMRPEEWNMMETSNLGLSIPRSLPTCLIFGCWRLCFSHLLW